MFFLTAAFVTVWVLVTGYVVYMSNRQRHLEQELDILEELVQEKSTQP